MVSEYMNMDEVVAILPCLKPEGWQRSLQDLQQRESMTIDYVNG